MTGMPDKNLKPGVIKTSNNNTYITLLENFKVKWHVKDIFYHFRNLNNFPPNPLNEHKTIMQSKNGQELPV
jgi:hypothetical protein